MCRLQNNWLRTIYSLVWLLLPGGLYGAEEVKIYSALDEPLVAEVGMTQQERDSQQITVEQSGYSPQQWRAIPMSQRETLLLLSEKKVEQPIVELTLKGGDQEEGRRVTLFLNPDSNHSKIEYLERLIVERNRALQQSRSLAEQNLQLQQQLEQMRQAGWGWLRLPEGMVASSWMLFLLLGGAVSLLLLYRWRSAESVDLAPAMESATVEAAKPDSDHGEEAWQVFEQGVQQIERSIERSPPSNEQNQDQNR